MTTPSAVTNDPQSRMVFQLGTPWRHFRLAGPDLLRLFLYLRQTRILAFPSDVDHLAQFTPKEPSPSAPKRLFILRPLTSLIQPNLELF